MKCTYKIVIYLFFTLFFVSNHSLFANPIDTINQVKAIDLPLLITSKGRFEMGLEFGVLRTYIEYLPNYEELENLNKGRFEYQWENTPITGFAFRHILNKKWWLETGFRFGRSRWSNAILFESYYNKSGEYIQTNGEVGYRLTLVNSGTINDSKMNLFTSVINASSLEDNDLIVSALRLEKSINWIQIPLGITYHFGKKQLNYMIKSGISLNQITTTNHSVEGFIESNISQLIINDVDYQRSNPKGFIEYNIGAGFRYHVQENISIYSHFNLRLAPAIQVFTDNIYSSFFLGMNYTF